MSAGFLEKLNPESWPERSCFLSALIRVVIGFLLGFRLVSGLSGSFEWPLRPDS